MTETNQTQKPSPIGVIIGAALTVLFAAVGIYWRMEISGTKLLFNDSATARLYRYYWLMLLFGLISAAVTAVLFVRLRREMAKYNAEHPDKVAPETTEATAPELPAPDKTEPVKSDDSACCPNCKKELEPGAKFCTGCGHKLS